jgi:hypothetical protein
MLRWLIGVFALLLAHPAGAEIVTHARFERNVIEYMVNRDLTWESTQILDVTLLTGAAVRGFARLAASFYPDKQTLEAKEAWVDLPDGSRVVVPASGIVTRQSQAARNAPGFVSSMTTTIVFPQLREGSRVHVVWHRTQKIPALLGFSAYSIGALDGIEIVNNQVHITAPEEVPLRWAQRGNVVVQASVADGMRHVVATLPHFPARMGERAAVSNRDFEPMFVASSLRQPEEIGALIYRASAGLAEVTPELAALAQQIAGERTGLEAARAIHAWITGNIRYVAVYLNPDDGLVPHRAAEVLHAGYGDCKDYTVLMQALLAARGIRAVPAILDWGTQYADPPLLTGYYGNHEIVYLPDYDHFVNPTDRNAPFDALDRRLSGKLAVLVTPEGQVTRTPASTPQANRYRYSARLTLEADGTLHGTAEYAMSANAEIGARSALNGAASMEDLGRRVLSNTREGGFGVLHGSDPRDLLHPLDLSAAWESPMAVNRQGEETYLRVPQGMDLFPPSAHREKLLHTGARGTPVLADAADLQWENEIALPPGMRAALLPGDVDVATSAGRYTARYRAADGIIHVSRNLVIARDVVAPREYAGLKALLTAPVVDARAVIALTSVEE